MIILWSRRACRFLPIYFNLTSGDLKNKNVNGDMDAYINMYPIVEITSINYNSIALL